MADKDYISPAILKQFVSYDEKTGALMWLFQKELTHFKTPKGRNIFNARFAGKPAFATKLSDGRLTGSLCKKRYLAHRAAWAIWHGSWPKNQIDHINGDPSDNRIVNLRDVTVQENRMNLRRPDKNKTGVIGVSKDPEYDLYRATIGVGKKHIHLGRFKTIDEAAIVRRAAEIKYGFHPNHGMR